MRLARLFLIHYCTFEHQVIALGDSGEDVKTWKDSKAVPCRYFTGNQAVADNAQGDPIRYDAKIILDRDITSDDVFLTSRVKSVILEDERVEDGPWLIDRIVPKRLRSRYSTTLFLRRVPTSEKDE